MRFDVCHQLTNECVSSCANSRLGFTLLDDNFFETQGNSMAMPIGHRNAMLLFLKRQSADYFNDKYFFIFFIVCIIHLIQK